MAPFLLIESVYLVIQMLMESLKPLLTLNSRKYYFKRAGLHLSGSLADGGPVGSGWS